jgi:redox-sensitive bicupin YhaK (pirin superfamily)
MSAATPVSSPQPALPQREVARLLKGEATSDGAGVRLTRMLDTRLAAQADPFLLFDEFRSDQPGDYIGGFPPHPHRGFETVTYMMAGHMRHGDNKGNSGDLGPGSAQWMTAARGIVHEERPQQENGLLWGYQLWVNLPAAEKMGEPVYQDIPPQDIPEVSLENGGKVRVITGEFNGVRGPVRPRPTEPIYLDVKLPANAQFSHALPAGHTAFVHGIAGELRIGAQAQPVGARELALLTSGGELQVSAGAEAAHFLVIAGKPLREQIAHYGPFVMNTREEIMQAARDFEAGRF